MNKNSELTLSNGLVIRGGTLINILKMFIYAIVNYTEQLFQRTSMHGVKYFFNIAFYFFERCFFLLAFITALLFNGYFIFNVLEKWTKTPVIFGTNPFPSFITEEPFPAVTICNLNMAYKSKTDQFPIDSTEYAMLQTLCRRNANLTIDKNIADFRNFTGFLNEIAQPCSNMLLVCRFGSVMYNCSDLFKSIITDEGLCCTFNTLHPAFIFNLKNYKNDSEAEDASGFMPVAWSTESGYQSNLPKKFYPRPAVGVGETLGLSVTLDVESDDYYCSSLSSVGFKTFLHSPMQSPSLRELGILIGPGRETKGLIQTEKYVTDLKLRSMDRKYRDCLFQDEEKLIAHLHYTESNCETECLAKMLMKHCGCIAYYMPSIYGNETICNIFQSECVEKIRINLLLAEYNSTTCEKDCLPSCFDIDYIQDFVSAPLTNVGYLIPKKLSSSYITQNIVVMHVYFNAHIYRSFLKTEFFGDIDALSSFGGLIGLSVGFSFIFIAEFIFFAMIKPFRHRRQTDESTQNLLIVNNSNIEVHSWWKKPIRKRYSRYGNGSNNTLFAGSNPFRDSNNGQEHMAKEFFTQKWFSRRQV